MAVNYLRFLANVVIGALFGVALGLLLELLILPTGWTIVLAMTGAIIGAIVFAVKLPPPERT